jgi:hypothetical protein
MTTMNEYIKLGGLEIAQPLFKIIKNDITPETGVDNDKFWFSTKMKDWIWLHKGKKT